MKTWLVALTCALTMTCALATTVTAQNASGVAGAAAIAEKGKMLVSANGARLGIIYRVNPDGSAQLIIDGKMVTVPASSISNVDGKLTTSLTKSEVLALR